MELGVLGEALQRLVPARVVGGDASEGGVVAEDPVDLGDLLAPAGEHPVRHLHRAPLQVDAQLVGEVADAVVGLLLRDEPGHQEPLGLVPAPPAGVEGGVEGELALVGVAPRGDHGGREVLGGVAGVRARHLPPRQQPVDVVLHRVGEGLVLTGRQRRRVTVSSSAVPASSSTRRQNRSGVTTSPQRSPPGTHSTSPRSRLAWRARMKTRSESRLR